MHPDWAYCYPPPDCQDCGRPCYLVEEVETCPGEWEQWCYCPFCKVETFAAPIFAYRLVKL